MIALLVAFTMTDPTVTLKVSQAGKDLGEATVTHRVSPSGGKSQITQLILRRPGAETRIRQESQFAADGSPVRKVLEVFGPEKGTRRVTIATFNAEGASVVDVVGTQRKTQRVTLVAGAPRDNPAEFWFLRDQPNKGAQVKRFTFDAMAQEWALTEITYVGREAEPRAGHRLRMRQGDRVTDSIVDDRGLPVWIEDSNGLRMVRS